MTPPNTSSEVETLNDVLWRIGAFDRLNHDQICEIEKWHDKTITQSEIKGRNEMWGITYGFLHLNDRRLCEEWEEEVESLNQMKGKDK